jgi:hypothetical protein
MVLVKNMTVESIILSENNLSLSSKPGVDKWDFNIYPKILLIISSVGVYIVNEEKFFCNLKSTVKEPLL